MSKLNEKMKEFYTGKGFSEDEYNDFLSSSVNISLIISSYAHREQYRENGNSYSVHPYSCLNLYRDFVGIEENSYDCIDLDLMYKFREKCRILDDIKDSYEVKFV